MYTNKSYTTKKQEATIIDIPEAPADSVSDISFTPDNAAMAVSAWDSTVTVYALSLGGYGAPQAPRRTRVHALPAPALSTAFFGSTLLAGLVDGSLVCIDAAGTQTAIPAHGAGVKGVRNYNNQFVVTGSFDGTLKFWDLKSTAPIHTIPLPAKVYALSLSGSLLCVALSNKTIMVFDMNNMGVPASFTSRFTYGLRSVGCGLDMDSFAVGGIEAKIEIFSRSVETKKYIARAHREGTRLYAVNIVRYYPADPNILVSGGADGTLIWFDRVNRLKIASLPGTAPVTAGEFTVDGRFFVFATGDDWSKGYTGSYVKPILRMVEAKSIPGLNK